MIQKLILRRLGYFASGLMLFSACNISMQQKKQKRLKRDSKPSIGPSHIGERISTLASNRSQDTKSKLHSSRDSYLKEFKKTKVKLNTLSSIGNLNIEDQIKKEISQLLDLLKDCDNRLQQGKIAHSEKEDLIHLEDVIKNKDETIKSLGVEIQNLKKSDRNIPEEDSHSSGNKNTDSSDKERMFKLAEEMHNEREDLSKLMQDHVEKHNNYLKIKKMIEEIELKYTKHDGKSVRQEGYNGPPLMSYQQFKEKAKTKKDETFNKVKKIDFYHQISPQKQLNPSKNMKDLLTRKNITMAALKNSRKKHGVEMTELIAKLDFLKDEDAHLTQKIKEKEQELASMQKKFSQKRGENHRIDRNQLLHFHS